MTDERFLVTGGTGCIGSWVVRSLVEEGAPVTVLTARGQLGRLALLLPEAAITGLDIVEGDICDLALLEQLARDRGITRIIHLAALQLPFCAADPVAGARVNVQGTATMFELARRLGIGRLVYASSAAVYGPRAHYGVDVLPADAPLFPTSHYGVFKVANEQDAGVWWETQGVASIGLRPHSVYGPGRDQGVTSKPTVAMIAAVARRPYRIGFGGRVQLQFAGDVARAFITAARADLPGALAFSLPGPAFGIDEVVAAIEAVEPAAHGLLSFEDRELPFCPAFDGGPFEEAFGRTGRTPLEEGVRLTVESYRRAIRDGRLEEAYLDRVLSA